MRLPIVVVVVVMLSLLASGASGTPKHVVDANRIVLGDLAPDSPVQLAQHDLGAAPPPGASRIVTRAVIERSLRAVGVDTRGLQLPSSVRVTSAARRLTRNELSKWLKPAIEQSLPHGTALRQISAARGIVTSPSATIGSVRISQPPRRVGTAHSTAIIELHRDGVLLQRLTAAIVLDISEEGAKPDVERGAAMTLVMEAGGARVTAAAVALEASEVGAVRMFRILKTRKVLRARVIDKRTALVVAQ